MARATQTGQPSTMALPPRTERPQTTAPSRARPRRACRSPTRNLPIPLTPEHPTGDRMPSRRARRDTECQRPQASTRAGAAFTRVVPADRVAVGGSRRSDSSVRSRAGANRGATSLKDVGPTVVSHDIERSTAETARSRVAARSSSAGGSCTTAILLMGVQSSRWRAAMLRPQLGSFRTFA
jgi:hypothetical protein